jgi:hypothetical protein
MLTWGISKSAPARPDRGAIVRLMAEATSPVGLPVTLRWERQNSRWDWAEIGEGAELEWQVPEGPKSTSIRAIASDGIAESSRYLYVTPVNSSPEMLSVDVEEELGDVVAGQRITLMATATDPDGDPLTFNWRSYPGWWSPWPPPTEAMAVWQAPWSPDDRTYSIGVTATDGALTDYSNSIEVTVQGRPDPITSLEISPAQGNAPLAVSFTADAQDPQGQIARYIWPGKARW